MSIYVPHDTILRCSQSVKVSRLNVTSQKKSKLIDGRLKGTFLDKMNENFVCPFILMAGLAVGMVVMAALAPLGMLACGLMGLVGGLVGGVSGAIKGWNTGSKVGGAVGGEIGRILGASAGGNILGTTGAIQGAVDKGLKGATTGSQTGGEIGRDVGETVGTGVGAAAGNSVMGPLGIPAGMQAGKTVGGAAGEVQGQVAGAAVGGTIGTIGGAAEGGAQGYVEGAKAGGEMGRQVGETVGSTSLGVSAATAGFVQGFTAGAIKGAMFLPSYLGGLLISIPPICAVITSPIWLFFHLRVRVEGKFALLKTSILPCLMGGIIKPWMEDLAPHLRRALVSEAIYYNPDNEKVMKEKLSKEEFDKWKEKQADIFKALADNGVEKVVPKNKDLEKKMKTDSGFMAEIYSYKNSENKEVYIMVFKGTDNEVQAETDWTNNGQNAVGLESDQYSDTEKAAEGFDEAYSDSDIEFAGHSKAGGQATLAAAATKKTATVFDPAGVSDATFERAGTSRAVADQHVTSFHSQNSDILNTLQDHTYGLVPQAAGDRIGINTGVPFLFPDPVKGHGMEHLIEVLQEEVKRYKKLVKANQM